MNTARITKCVELAEKTGWQSSEDLSELLMSLTNPHYRVFLAGEFQVGKSLLADRVFLNGRGLLPSGIGLPTTSVVTEIIYGDAIMMKVFYKGNNTPIVIPNPTAADITKYTTASSEEERSSLSETIEKVVITVPDDNLKRYAVMDSPGIDDANESIMINSTLPQIQTADAVIFVIPPRSLDSIEKKFLQGFLFEKSISRLMILISYNPRRPLGKKALEELVENIKAELRMMGRDHVKVDVCCYDDSVDGTLNTPERIRSAIDSFALSNVEEGRASRVAGRLLNSFGAYENELKTRLELNGAKKEKFDEMALQLEKAEQTLSARLVSAKSNLSAKEADISTAARERLQKEMQSLKEKLISHFDSCSDLSEVQFQLDVVKDEMESNLKQIFATEASAAKTQIEGVLSEVDRELKNAANELLSTLEFGYEINTGHLGKLNSKFVTFLDYLLTVLVSPVALGMDVLIRYILGRIPIIKNLMPAVFVRNKVVKTIGKSLDEICAKVVLDITAQFKQCFKRIEDDVNTHFKLLYQATVMPIQKAIEESANSQLTPDEVEKLRSKYESIREVSKELQNC